MTQFQFDTTGIVGSPYDDKPYAWAHLTPFAQGYIEALFASNRGEWNEDSRESLAYLGFSDLAPETLARIIADCEAFGAAPCAAGGVYSGKLFWRARKNPEHPKGAAGGNRYWDTVADFPPLTVQLGDDGKVRFA